MPEVRVPHSIPQETLFRSLCSPSSYAAFETAMDLTLHFRADLHFVHVVSLSPEFTDADVSREMLKRQQSVKAKLTMFSQDSVWSLQRQTSEDIGRTWP